MPVPTHASSASELAVLPFAVLVYRKQVADVGPVWFAASVFTGHTTHGDSADEALEAIGLTLERAVELGREYGYAPHDWFARQHPCESARVEIFRGLVAEGGAEALTRQCPTCCLALQVARSAA